MRKLKDWAALTAGVLFLCMGAEIIFLGKSSVKSAGWHTRGQVITASQSQEYRGWERLTGIWMMVIGGVITAGAYQFLKKRG